VRDPAFPPDNGQRPTDRDAAIDLSLARGVLYRSVALGLRRTTEHSPCSLSSPATWVAVQGAAALVDARCPHDEPLLPSVQALCAHPASPAERSSAHSRLFGHSRGLVCPFETEYGPEGAFRQPQELADIAGYYFAFGLRPAEGSDERVDHAACECEFMEFLARKQAFALASLREGSGEGDPSEQLETIRAATRSFLRDHLGRFGRAFASLLMREDAGGFHGSIGAILFLLLAKESQLFGLPPGPPSLDLRPPLPDDTPLGCGSCEERIEVQRRAQS